MSDGLPGWIAPRDGLAAAFARLRAGPAAIAYAGNSVTAQKAGYRPLLHARLCALTGHAHRAINGGFGGVGSMASLYTLDRLVLRFRPALCFVECTVADQRGATPLAAIAPVVDGILDALVRSGAAPCLIHAYHRDHEFGADAPLPALYDAVAATYGVPSINIGRAVCDRIAAGTLAPGDFTFDRLHTTPAGAALMSDLVTDAVAHCAAVAPPAAPRRAPPPPRNDFRAATLHAAHRGMAAPGSVAKPGLFKLIFPFVELGIGQSLAWTPPHEVAGMLVIVGPDSGVVTVQSGEKATDYQLWDEWCSYDRLQAVIWPEPLTAYTTMRITMTGAEDGESVAGAPRASIAKAGTVAKIIGFFMRPVSACGQSAVAAGPGAAP